MSIQPDLVGTVTLTSGSTAFTWAGTSLVSAGIQAGDEIKLPDKAMVLTIATVTSATEGTLTDNCPAAAEGSGQAARVRYQSDLSRVAAQTRQLIELLGTGNVSALSGLTGAADRLPYFTGAGTMALAAITSAARGVLDDSNVDAMRETLMSASGLGAACTTITNLNNITSNGYYIATTPFDNTPNGNFCIVEHIQSSAATAFQRAHVAGIAYYRRKSSSVWSEWTLDGGLVGLTVRAASGTHTFNVLSNTALVIAIGAGGGGGSATGDAGYAAAGGGGGSGAVVWKRLNLNAIASVSCTIGAGGAGNGGTTSVSGSGFTTLSAGGGTAGGAGPSTGVIGVADGGTGGGAANGDVNMSGGPGESGFSQGATINGTMNMNGGNGADCMFGNGGRGGTLRGASSGGANGAGAATGFGGGGGGAVRYGFAATNTGGAGGNGAVIILEMR